MGSRQQTVIFLSLYISYLLYVYVRRSVTYAVPTLASQENIDTEQLGLILSSQMFAYAVSKFLCGVLVDTVSPRLGLCFGLFASGLTVLLFSCVPSFVSLYTILWLLNGLAGGPGWPAAALIMKAWFRKDQFGRAWSVLSTSMNVAGTMGPLVTAFVITEAGWRTSLFIPGAMSMLVAIIVFLVVKDTQAGNMPLYRTFTDAKEKDRQEETKISRIGLFKLPGYAGICLTYGTISVIQYGCLQWGPLYLVQDKKHSVITGNSYVSSLEVGGIVGSLLAGWFSDSLLSKVWASYPPFGSAHDLFSFWRNSENYYKIYNAFLRKSATQSDHPDRPIHAIRQYVIAWFSAGLAVVLLLLAWSINENSAVLWISFIGFGLGLTIYGPVAMFGVVAMETAPDHLSGAAHAVVCLFANGGQTFAGLPLSYMSTLYNWQTVFLAQSGLAAAVALYLYFYSIYLYKNTRAKRE